MCVFFYTRVRTSRAATFSLFRGKQEREMKRYKEHNGNDVCERDQVHEREREAGAEPCRYARSREER